MRGIAAVLFMTLASAATAANSPRTFLGRISDSECGLDHSRMKAQHHIPTDLKCTRECCENYQQEYVLADHASSEVYQLDDQKLARRFANRTVRVLGTLEAESGAITVQKIEPVR